MLQRYILYLYRNNRIDDSFSFDVYDDISASKKAERLFKMVPEVEMAQLFKGVKRIETFKPKVTKFMSK